jgi:zinc protease
VVVLPQTGQAAVMMGARGAPRRGEDYLDTLLANAVLGGGSAGRLNLEIRERRGLSYGAFSQFAARGAPGPIVAQAQTRNDAAVQVVGLMDAEFRRLRETPTPADELEARRSGLIGAFGRSVETNAGLAGQLATLALYGLPADRLNSYVADLGRITAEQVRAAANRHLDPAHLDLVVVGDARLFYDELARARPNAERIAVGDLNLDREALR